MHRCPATDAALRRSTVHRARDADAADLGTSLEELDRARFAETISEMEAKLAEKEGSELDHAIERLDHYKNIQHQLSTTALH